MRSLSLSTTQKTLNQIVDVQKIFLAIGTA
jgi:hypothetical protein